MAYHDCRPQTDSLLVPKKVIFAGEISGSLFVLDQQYLGAVDLSSLHRTANSHWLSILHMVIYIFQCYSLTSSFCFFPQCAHKSVLCVCEGLEVSSLKNVLLEQEVKKLANTWDTGINPTFLPSFHSFFLSCKSEDILHTQF